MYLCQLCNLIIKFNFLGKNFMDVVAQEVSIDNANVQTIANWLSSGEALLVDVRETSEFEKEHIPGALLVPLSVLNPQTFPHFQIKKLVLYCATGIRSNAAAKMLIKAGHKPPISMAGGIETWRKAGLETEIFDEPKNIK